MVRYARLLSLGALCCLAIALPVRADDAPPAQKPMEAVKPEPKRELSPGMVTLRERERQVLAMCARQPFSTQGNTATDLIHFSLGFGCSTEVATPGQEKKINGITALCWGYPCAGYELLTVVDGHVSARVGYGYQEQPTQFLAMLAQSYVPANYPIRVGEDVRSVGDLVETEKRSCRAGQDLSLKLVALAYYAEDAAWKNSLGDEWSVERLVKEELAQPVIGAPCGGLNRLLGLSAALERRARRKKPIDGQYLRAQKYVAEFQDFAFSTQNSDGSWGPQFMATREVGRDYAGPLRSTGHILEWLALSLPDGRLEDPRVIRSVEYLVGMLGSQRYQWNVPAMSSQEIGAVGHAIHALVLYDGRVFQPFDPKPEAKPEAKADAKKP